IRIPPAAFGDPLGPRIFPTILGSSMAACGAYLIAKPQAKAGAVLVRGPFLQVLLLCALLILYALSLPGLGYLLSTFALVWIAARVMGERSFLRGAAISGAFSAGVYFLFTRFLTIPLPPGVLKSLGLG
ncbi:MAG TPA: tripartite tricarboxylate transporter TctB family protein, partial [Thermodesulfobacteriota bacterium]|nr:tripartite tricarboxylate transporter TctB family protein [Thermodesulfobacteriota bacterium]